MNVFYWFLSIVYSRVDEIVLKMLLRVLVFLAPYFAHICSVTLVTVCSVTLVTVCSVTLVTVCSVTLVIVCSVTLELFFQRTFLLVYVKNLLKKLIFK